MNKKELHILLMAILPILLFSGCSRPVAHHGYFDKGNRLAKIEVNTSTRRDVIEHLGTPSFEGAFTSRRWYYVGQSFKINILTQPNEVDRQIIEIDFDDVDRVRGVKTYTLADGAVIEPEADTTPVVDIDLSAIQQIVSNIGKVASPSQAN